MRAPTENTTYFSNGIMLQFHDESMSCVHVQYTNRLLHGRMRVLSVAIDKKDAGALLFLYSGSAETQLSHDRTETQCVVTIMLCLRYDAC